ncbi:MAG TPA: RNA polymerase sigma factor [Thermoanaerobaculia bacterium]|nr:RNA polymerase sigma factor [Thermoanaerobaculia bacterium]
MNDDWFADLYQRFYSSIFAYFVRIGFPREDARDLAQETFLRVYRGMERYEGRGDFAFLKKTAVRVGINAIRDKRTAKRQAVVVPLDELPHIAAGAENPAGEPQPTPEADAALHEETVARRSWLKQAIAALPPAQRDCLLLRLGGLKYREVARAMGVPIDTVKSRLHEARRTLSEGYRAGAGGLELPPELEDDDHD